MGKVFFRLSVIVCALFLSLTLFLEGIHAAGPIIGTPPPTQPSVADDDKGPVGGLTSKIYATQTELQSLGTVWQVTECCGWTGTWTRRPGTNTFDAKWKHTNGTTAQDVITLQSWNKSTGKVTLKRHGLNGEYAGTLNTQAKTITQGTATWYKAGDTWSARY